MSPHSPLGTPDAATTAASDGAVAALALGIAPRNGILVALALA